jgi:H+/Cl- antiporter ClcA
MSVREHFRHQLSLIRRAGSWLPLVSLIAVSAGSLTALFLYGLDYVTRLRWNAPWLLYGLPLVGVLIRALYRYCGSQALKGNDLILEEIHKPSAGVPFGMAPLVLITTLLTHLGGGSAGREGTAVQVGGSMAGWLGRRWGTAVEDSALLLCCGMAAGFGAVFGTPLAGAIFAIEVLAIGRSNYRNILPCLYAAFIGDAACALWGVKHTQYQIGSPVPHNVHDFIQPALLLQSAIGGICFGLAAMLFARSLHGIKGLAARCISTEWLRPVIGATILITLTTGFGLDDYLGLGVTTADGSGVSILNAFSAGGATTWSWLWKLIFTAITLGTGFKGGEVTPLFFIGSTLGNTLAMMGGAPVDLMAALGFIAVFAGAANTPLACVIMGCELFGRQWVPYYAVACFLAYECSGHQGIYSSQIIQRGKRIRQYSKWVRNRKQP